MLHTLTGGRPKLGTQRHWFPLEPGPSFGVGIPGSFLLSFLESYYFLENFPTENLVYTCFSNTSASASPSAVY